MPLSCLCMIGMAMMRSGWVLQPRNRHGAEAYDFATVSGCDQLVVGPTHVCGGTLDVPMIDVPDLVWVDVALI